MTKLDDRTITNMDWALEQACRAFPHGGDHKRRRYVAQKLELSARKGNITLDGLIIVAKAAVCTENLIRVDEAMESPKLAE
jgi:hypothetical protein